MGVKVLGLAGSLGAVATGGGIYGAVKSSQKSTSISSLLSSEKGLLLITETTDAKWDEAGKKYRDAQKEAGSQNYKAQDKWKIRDGSAQKNQDTAPEAFKQECKRQATLEVYGKDIQEYKDVKNWCTRPKKVGELLSSEGNRILLSRTRDDREGGESGTRYKSHHEKNRQGSSVTYETTDELGVANGTTKSTETNVPTEYKTACQVKSEGYIDPEKATEDDTFKKVIKWCTKDKPKS